MLAGPAPREIGPLERLLGELLRTVRVTAEQPRGAQQIMLVGAHEGGELGVGGRGLPDDPHLDALFARLVGALVATWSGRGRQLGAQGLGDGHTLHTHQHRGRLPEPGTDQPMREKPSSNAE